MSKANRVTYLLISLAIISAVTAAYYLFFVPAFNEYQGIIFPWSQPPALETGWRHFAFWPPIPSTEADPFVTYSFIAPFVITLLGIVVFWIKDRSSRVIFLWALLFIIAITIAQRFSDFGYFFLPAAALLFTAAVIETGLLKKAHRTKETIFVHKLWPLKAIFILLLLVTVMFATACNPPSITYFPIQQEISPSPAVLGRGKLVLEDGCLRLWTGKSYLLIWPPGYSYRTIESDVEVIDEKGDIVARTSQYKKFGGGEVPSIKLLTGSSPPENGRGPYWMVGEVVGNWYIWDSGAGPGIIIVGLVALVCGIAVFLVLRKR
ncbi:hypothetical protein DGWBC_0039 [Dehalogenimonas sp. WBC-2]|nr:hypothetical protein DGWBC_0039 [Dehalogenimonas sp. WBC-2]